MPNRPAPSGSTPLEAAYGFAEAAVVCGVSRDTIKRRHRAGYFAHAWRADSSRGTGTGQWMVPRSDLVMAGLEPRSNRSTEAPREEGSSEETSGCSAEILEIRLQLAVAEARADALAEALRIIASATPRGSDDATNQPHPSV